MPRLTIRQHGASASIPRHPIAGNLQKPEERKANRGWTAAVARRNSQYLQRIDFERVDGTPYAVTLTLPAWQMEQVTPVVMHRLIDVMIKYLRRHGMLHFHWIIEFTARRMPHIHMSVWMADRYEEWDRHLRQYIVWDNNESAVVSNVVVKWLELTEAEGLHTSSNSQDVQLIDGTRRGSSTSRNTASAASNTTSGHWITCQTNGVTVPARCGDTTGKCQWLTTAFCLWTCGLSTSSAERRANGVAPMPA